MDPSLKSHLFLAVLVGLAVAGCASLATAADPPVPVTRLVSIHPEHPDASDLEPLVQAIGKARVVVLAPPSFDDGAALWAMTRLTRNLLQHHGFSVVAFEAGLYDCRVMNRQFAAGTDPIIALPQGLPDALARSGYTADLWRFVWRSYLTRNPVEVCGFGPVFTGSRTARQLPRDLLEYLGLIEPHPLTRDQRRTYLTVLERFNEAVQGHDASQVARAWEQLNQLHATLRKHKPELVKATDEIEFAWWDLIVTDAIENARAAMQMVGDDSHLARRTRIQNRMGEHLVWLITEIYPDRNIIVWANASTALRDLKNVNFDPPHADGEGLVSAGDTWYRVLRDDLYVIGFTSSHGSRGSVRGAPVAVTMPPARSLEARFAEVQWPFLFADLRCDKPREPGWDWLDQPARSTMLAQDHLFGLSDPTSARAIWGNHVDGLLYLRSAYPNSFEARAPDGESHTVHVE